MMDVIPSRNKILRARSSSELERANGTNSLSQSPAGRGLRKPINK